MRYKILTLMAICFAISLFSVYSVHAYVYFVEAEKYDEKTSTPVAGGATWKIIEDKNAFNKKYLQYTGPHAQALTMLLYPLPPMPKSVGTWYVWVRCIMPDGGSDSYFFYVSTDGGKTWGPQQAAHGGGVWQDWQWKGWVLDTPFKKGDTNILRISERENAKADVICIRDDGKTPTDFEYQNYEPPSFKKVEFVGKLSQTWGAIKAK